MKVSSDDRSISRLTLLYLRCRRACMKVPLKMFSPVSLPAFSSLKLPSTRNDGQLSLANLHSSRTNQQAWWRFQNVALAPACTHRI